MINVGHLINILNKNYCNFFSGVPDSILKELSIYLKKNNKKHIIATNEGAATSIGIGYYLATKKLPCIYMQNSGLSNAINPLISIAHQKVYSIPLILIIGWRGSPRSKDEPQHMVKGKITLELLKLLKIKFTILRETNDLKKFSKQIKIAREKNRIVACLIEEGTLKKQNKIRKRNNYILNKSFFLKSLLEIVNKNYKIISSTGYNSRELLKLRDKFNLTKGKDFYMVGGMGHASSVALGYSMNKKNKTICLDGDGSLLMHFGSIKTAASNAKKNFKYILFNNNSHDSVGGQNTFSSEIDFKNLSKSIGFKRYFLISESKNLKKKINSFLKSKTLSFLEVKVANSKNDNLPRPKNLVEIKNLFMK